MKWEKGKPMLSSRSHEVGQCPWGQEGSRGWLKASPHPWPPCPRAGQANRGVRGWAAKSIPGTRSTTQWGEVRRGTAPGTRTCWGAHSWKAALQKRSWWTPSWTLISNVTLLLRRPTVSWAALDKVLPAGEARWSFPSALARPPLEGCVQTWASREVQEKHGCTGERPPKLAGTGTVSGPPQVSALMQAPDRRVSQNHSQTTWNWGALFCGKGVHTWEKPAKNYIFIILQYLCKRLFNSRSHRFVRTSYSSKVCLCKAVFTYKSCGFGLPLPNLL